MNKYKTTIDFWRDINRDTAIQIAIEDFGIHPFDIKYKDWNYLNDGYRYRLQMSFINKEHFSRFIYHILKYNIKLTDIKIRKGGL